MAKRVRKSPTPKPKRRYRVTNWREYDRALIARGAITLWIDEAAIAAWGAAGGKGWRYSDMAILCALSLRAVFGLTLRQTQGFLHDLTRRLGLEIAVPHYSTFSRRAAALPVPKPARPSGGKGGRSQPIPFHATTPCELVMCLISFSIHNIVTSARHYATLRR